MSESRAGTARRADAVHNAEKIVRAAVTRLGRDPGASMGEIAKAAGVGRVTLYGHFPSREALVEAAVARVLEDGEEVLGRVDLTGPPPEALRRLIESSWLLTAQAGTLLEAARAVLPPSRVQELHARPARRVEELVRRGQSDKSFRSDLPVGWLVSFLHHVMKGAAVDVAAGRLDEADAPRFISKTVLSALAATG